MFPAGSNGDPTPRVACKIGRIRRYRVVSGFGRRRPFPRLAHSDAPCTGWSHLRRTCARNAVEILPPGVRQQSCRLQGLLGRLADLAFDEQIGGYGASSQRDEVVVMGEEDDLGDVRDLREDLEGCAGADVIELDEEV